MVRKSGSKWIVPVIIFLVALALRCYALPSRFIFTADEEYQATYARTIVQDFHPVWIGVSAADTGFYLGPYFTYLTAFLLKVSGGDPLVTGYAAAILGALTTVILYYLAELVGGKKVALVSVILYSFSPLMVYFDQRYWNPSPIPFLVCLLTLALINLDKNKWWLIVISFCLGAIWHVHLTLVPLYAVAGWTIWHSRAKLGVMPWLLSGMLFLLMLLPLMIFDYNHAWSNLLTPIRMMQSGTHSGLELKSHLSTLGTTLARFIYVRPGLTNDGELRNSCASGSTTPTPLFSSIALLPLLIFLCRPHSWRDPKRQIIASSLTLMVVAFIFYPGQVAAYYALGIIPLFFLVISLLGKKVWWLIALAFIVCSLMTLQQTDASYGLLVKQKLVGSVMSVVKEQPFSLEEAGDCHKYAGWRYIFLSLGHPPSTSSADSSLGWLYPKEIGKPGRYLVVVGATSEITVPKSSLAVETSGGYTAYSIDRGNE